MWLWRHPAPATGSSAAQPVTGTPPVLAGWREGAHPSTLPESFLSYVDAAKQCRCLRQYILKVLDGTGESPLCSSIAPRSGYVPFMFPKQTR
jgi:hypothetical protein